MATQIKDLPEDVQAAIKNLFKETNCADLYEGNAVQYINVATCNLREANKKVAGIKIEMEAHAGRLEEILYPRGR